MATACLIRDKLKPVGPNVATSLSEWILRYNVTLCNPKISF
jgi:hypothetical protein